MLFCCESNFIGKIYAIRDNQTFYNRIVEYSLCPICQKTTLKLTEVRYTDNKSFTTVYKGRKAHRALRELKPYFITHIRTTIKHGTKQNNNWVYGKTTVTKNGKKVYAVNFNGEKQRIT